MDALSLIAQGLTILFVSRRKPPPFFNNLD